MFRKGLEPPFILTPPFKGNFCIAYPENQPAVKSLALGPEGAKWNTDGLAAVASNHVLAACSLSACPNRWTHIAYIDPWTHYLMLMNEVEMFFFRRWLLPIQNTKLKKQRLHRTVCPQQRAVGVLDAVVHILLEEVLTPH